jgi:hypothetical protein
MEDPILRTNNFWIITLLVFVSGNILPQNTLGYSSKINNDEVKKYNAYRLGFLATSLSSASKNLLNTVVNSSLNTNRRTYYVVRKAKKPVMIDGNWDKSDWRTVKAIRIDNFLGKVPSFKPTVQAKMMYDRHNIYVIFKVNDCFVRNVVEEYNGPVSGDACVEFFFAPNNKQPDRYFNLEINAGGTPKMAYHIFQQTGYQNVSIEDLREIEIAHSLPKKVDPEIEIPVSWTVEYKIPISILEKYGSVIAPGRGVIWRANFYKTSSKSSNPHWMTWSAITDTTTRVKLGRFHQPDFFGQLNFKN